MSCKSSYFALLLYPDCVAHKAFMDCLESGSPFGFQFCYILHDKDLKDDAVVEVVDGDDGEEVEVDNCKKAHWHLFVKMPYPMGLMSVQKAFRSMGIVRRFVQMVSSPIGFSLYLTHSDPASRLAGKYKYDSTEIRGDLSIICLPDEFSYSGFHTLLREWKAGGSETGFTFSSCVLFLAKFGFYDWIKSQGFIATRAISEFVQEKKNISKVLKNTEDFIDYVSSD